MLMLLVHNTNKREFWNCYKTATRQIYSQKNLVYARDSKLSFVDSNIAGFEGY